MLAALKTAWKPIVASFVALVGVIAICVIPGILDSKPATPYGYTEGGWSMFRDENPRDCELIKWISNHKTASSARKNLIEVGMKGIREPLYKKTEMADRMIAKIAERCIKSGEDPTPMINGLPDYRRPSA